MKKTIVALVAVTMMVVCMVSVSGAEQIYGLRGYIMSMDSDKSEISCKVVEKGRNQYGLPDEIVIVLRKEQFQKMKLIFDNAKKRDPKAKFEVWARVKVKDGKYIAKTIMPPPYGD